MVATVAMLAGTAYLLMSSREVDPKFRKGVYISALVTGIACYHYQKMTVSFAEDEVFDTGLRYVDWVLTVPLMFVEVLAITSKGAEYATKVRTWGLAAVAMIAGGYYGEVNEVGGTEYWIGFVIAMAAYLFLMRGLQAEGESLTGDEAKAFTNIKNLILVGWIIYPLGYLAPAVSTELMSLRELLYTIADIINKVGLGVLVLNMARIKSGEKV
jgi:bacteriorhodopsin